MIVNTSFVLDVIDDLEAAVSMERTLEREGVPTGRPGDDGVGTLHRRGESGKRP